MIVSGFNFKVRIAHADISIFGAIHWDWIDIAEIFLENILDLVSAQSFVYIHLQLQS